jgi:general secretion pathway protein K
LVARAIVFCRLRRLGRAGCSYWQTTISDGLPHRAPGCFPSKSGRRGSALLAVLWLVAALSAIALSVAGTVRGEMERTSTALDGTRAYYLATGAVERAMLYMQWGQQYRDPDGSSQYCDSWTRSLRFSFPTGEAVVEIVPEIAKLNLNSARPQDLLRLLAALGVQPDPARQITAAIVDWRSAPGGEQFTDLDSYYLSLVPSFRSPHASFQEVEELLVVRGMTAELFHGRVERDAQDRLTPLAGLKDCVSVYGGTSVDVNTAPAAVLAAVGLGEQEVNAVLRAREAQPFRTLDQLRAVVAQDDVRARLVIGGGPLYTLRATARLRLADGALSDLSRSAGAMVLIGGQTGGRVLRWHDRL